jgi:ribosome-associated toxin RatA of RatAB toxin-antitoxin module
MPSVTVEMTMAAPAQQVWEAVTALEDYPQFMENVRTVEVRETDAQGTRISNWSVTLKGSVLEWTEEDRTNDADRVMTFHQIDGDLDRFIGEWRVLEIGSATSVVRLSIDFEIGIPLLADMLNPVAGKALQENCEQMLTAIEKRTVGDPDVVRS